jgi:hypothetical protein
MPFLDPTPPGARVEIIRGTTGASGKQGDPGPAGDPTILRQEFLDDDGKLREELVPGSVVSRVPETISDVTYDDGRMVTITQGGVPTTLTYNDDGTVATVTTLGKVQTLVYTDGLLTGATVVNA